MRGVRTTGPMAQEIALDKQRPAQFMFSRHVEQMLSGIQTTGSKAAASPTKSPQPQTPAVVE
jgi:hypothetical protein